MSENETRDISGITPDTIPNTTTKGKNYLLGIGIDHYQNFIPLKNAVKDVQDVSNILVTKYDFHQEDVKLLLNENATRENIIEELNQLSRVVGENDKILIYYSGHGYLNEENNRGYWIPIEGEKNKSSTFVANANLRDYVKSIRSRHTLLISDSCFSGSLLVRDATRQVSGAFETWEARKSRYVFASGKGIVSDGKENENSPFAKAIIDQLSNPPESKLNIIRLADEVTRSVRFNHEQQPEIHPFFDTGHDGGQFVFNLKATSVKTKALNFINTGKINPAQTSSTIPVSGASMITYSYTIISKILPVLLIAGASLWYFILPQFSPADTISEPVTPQMSPPASKIPDYIPNDKIEVRKHKTPPLNVFATPKLNMDWDGDNIKVTIKLGKPPYKLKLYRKNKAVVSKSYSKAGIFTLPIGDYRTDPGVYKLVLTDELGRKDEMAIKIDPTGKSIITSPVITPAVASLIKLNGTVAHKGKTYKWRKLKDGKRWMTENLNYKIPGSWCFEDKDKNCEKYGRLYTWEAAQKACPSGWHLPTDEEWKALASKYGGYKDAQSNLNVGNPTLGYKNLLVQGGLNFGAVMGGRRHPSGHYDYTGMLGHYWTQSDGKIHADGRVYKFHGEVLWRFSANKEFGFSCRCVED